MSELKCHVSFDIYTILWQMAKDFEDLQDNFIMKCIWYCYHSSSKSCKIGKMSGTFGGGGGSRNTVHTMIVSMERS